MSPSELTLNRNRELFAWRKDHPIRLHWFARLPVYPDNIHSVAQ